MRERRGADEGLVVVGGDVGQLRDGVADPLQLGQALGRHDRQAHLGDQVADQREGVGVAGPLAVAVRRPLDVGDARPRPRRGSWRRRSRCRPGSGCRAGRRRGARTSATTRPTPIGSMPPLVSHRTPTSAPAANAASQHPHAVVAVVRVAVEEVLAVEEHPPAVADEEGDRVGHHGEVLLQRRPQGLARRAGRRTSRPGRRPASRASSSARTCGSSSTRTPALRVAPNATSCACRSFSSVRARAKNSVSFGSAPGQPPSMNPTPTSSSSRATASLSATRVADALALGAVAQRGVEDVEVEVGGHRDLLLVGLARTNKKTPRVREVCAQSGW